MSTNINITVGGNSLVDQAKAQQQAARQAQLEKENRAQLQRRAEIDRINALAAQGKDAQGNSLSGLQTRSQFRADEPAANKNDSGYPVALGYLHNYENTTYFDPVSNSTMPDVARFKIYSGDGSAFAQFELKHARYPAPVLRWGTTDYNTTNYFNADAAAATWSAGYEVDPFNTWSILGLSNQEGAPYVDSINPQFTPALYADEFEDAACTVPTGRKYYNRNNDHGDVFTPGIMYRNWEWWQTGPTLTGGTHVITRRSLWQYGPYRNTYCLPAGNDSFVIIVSFIHGKYFHYYGQKLTFTAQATSYGVVELFTEGPYNARWYKWYAANGQSNKTRSLVDEFNEIYENKTVKTLAFFVTTKTVKQIPVPTALLAKVSNLHPGITSTPDWEQNTRPDDVVNNTAATISSTGAYTISSGLLTPSLSAPSNVAVYQRKIYLASTTIANSRPSPTISTQLLRGYGLARLTDGTILNTSFTPGVYSFLDNANELRESTDNNLLINYASVRSSYLANYPVNAVYIDTKLTLNSSRQQVNAFRYTKTQPETLYTQIPAADLKKNSVKPVLYLSGIGDQYQVWNWQKTTFCRQKLLSLGFTEADLTP